MTTVEKDVTAFFIQALELAYTKDVTVPSAGRMSIRQGNNLVYGTDADGAIVNNLDDRLVALLSAVAVDEKPPIELALEDQILDQPIDIQIDALIVLSYCDGICERRGLLDKVLGDGYLRETFTSLRDKARDAFIASEQSAGALLNTIEIARPAEVLVFKEQNQEIETERQEVAVVDDNYPINNHLEQTTAVYEATPEKVEFLVKEILEQSRLSAVASEVQPEAQLAVKIEVDAMSLPELQQGTPIQKTILEDEQVAKSEVPNIFEFPVEDQLAPVKLDVDSEQQVSQADTAVVAVSFADDMGVNSGASRMFVQAAENNLSAAIAETRDVDNNEAVDAAYRDLMRAKDVNAQVDASLREQQAHKLMTAIVAIAKASGKDEIKTKGGEYVVRLGSDGTALLTSVERGVIYDGLPNIVEASINLMSDLDINSLSKSVENTAAYMREAEKEKEQLEIE